MASLGEGVAVISIVFQSNDCVPEGQGWEGVLGPVPLLQGPAALREKKPGAWGISEEIIRVDVLSSMRIRVGRFPEVEGSMGGDVSIEPMKIHMREKSALTISSFRI